MRIVLAVLAASVLLPVLAVLALVMMFDADSAKPRIIAAVEAATGRSLVIAGPIRLVPGLHPSIELTDVSLSNIPGFSRPQMAMLKRLNLRVALLPLLSRRIEIDSLVVHGADILLEMNGEGQGNWRFTPRPVEMNPAGTPPAMASAKHPAPSIRIDKIEIADGRLAYRNAKMTAPVVLAVSVLTLTAGATDEPIRLSMAAMADATPLTLAGRIGPSNALFTSPVPPLNLDLTITAADTTLSVAGTIADPVRLSGTDLRIGANIPDLASLSALAYTPLPSLRGITAQTRLTDLPGKPGLLSGFILNDLKLALPQAELDGNISVTRGSPPLFQGKLHAVRIDADALRAATPAPARAAAPAPAPARALTQAPAAKSGPRPARLIPDQDLNFEALRTVDADLTLAIGELVQSGVTYRDLAAHVVLNAAALRIDPFTITTPGGPARGSLTVDAAKSAPPVAVTISAPSLSLAPLFAAFALPPYAQGNLWLHADLHGSGRSPHQIAATLDGSIGLSMEGAQIDTKWLGEMLGNVEMLKHVKSGPTALRCLAVRMDARNGSGTLRALMLDTAPVRLSGTGGLNLDEETLAIRLQITIRMGATGIGAPLDLGGTFLAPKIKLDAAVPGPGINANAPFGLVIGRLGLVQGSAGDTCAHDLAVARGETPPPEPAVEPATQPDTKPLKPADLLRQLLR